MTELTKKSLLVVKLCNLLLAEEMDRIKGTKAYKQKIKNLTNNLSDELDREYSETYALYMADEEGLNGINYTLTSLENIAEKISNMKNAEQLIEFNEHINKF